MNFTKPLMLCALLIAGTSSYANQYKQPFDIVVDKPTFVLPQFDGPYSEKEASIAPEELETAERLRSLLEQGKETEVLKELEDFYDIELSIAMVMLKAQLYFALEKYDQAEAAYLTALGRSPHLIRAHSDLGQLFLIKEQPKKAREYFAKAISLGAQDAHIYGQLAYLNLTLHGPYSAIQAYQQALAIEPDNEQWQQGLFIALTQAKMYPAAQALQKELIAKHPNKSKLWLNQAILKLELDDSRGALASLEMAILLGDKKESNLKTAAQLHMQLESYDRAVELINTHLSEYDLNLDSLNAYLTWLGQRGLWQQTQKILASIEPKINTLSNKEQSVIYLHQALLNKHLSKPTLALTDFKRSINANPNNGETLIAYADFLVAEQKFTQAETLLLRAEALEKFQKPAMLARAQMYVDLQNYQAALTVMKIVAARFNNTQPIKHQISLLENILLAKQQQDNL